MKNKKNKLFNKIIYLTFLIFITATLFNKTLEIKFDEIIKSVATGTSEENTDVKIIDGKLTYTGPDIRILEIEPADSFKLTDKQSERVTTGIENVKRTIDNEEYKIEITHMTMVEFIGKTEQLNGKYDVIVIGRYIDDNIKVNGLDYFKDFNETYWNPVQNRWITLTLESIKNKTWFIDYAHLENDITNKKANEIREFIQSGQLVYIDKTINQQYSRENSNNNNYYSNNVNWTKLHYHLTDNNGYFVKDNVSNLNNFIKDKKINDITIDSILDKYIEQENRGLNKQVIYSTSPESDAVGSLGDINKRNMIFNISSNKSRNEDLTINLYLDINGDALFKEDEIVKTVTGVNFSNGSYKLEYNIYEEYPQFIGYLDWKIEVIKNNEGYSQPIKSYYQRNILFRRLEGEEKRRINVLQVLPIKRSNPMFNKTTSAGEKIWSIWYNGNLNLEMNSRFQGLLKSKEVSDYDIQIDVISYEDFYQGRYYGPGNEDLNKSKYDMIIMGFSDMYPEAGISEMAVNHLKAYVAAGKSLMLTHDTLSYWKAWDDLGNASFLMKAFRDIAGQSRYKDKLNDGKENTITHDPNKPSESSDIKKANGSSFVSMYDNFDSYTTESNLVYKTNETVLTNYPFKIKEDEIPVRETHGQYFQLNLEDEDTVPILNLTEQNSASAGLYSNSISYNNRYDSRNFYYTYSRGNITFSGTGENGRENIEYPYEEMKLFINTIVKAERSANHKPVISGLDEDKATEISIPTTEDDLNFDFKIIVKDIDNDLVKLNKVLLDGSEINVGLPEKDTHKESGRTYSLTLIKSLLKNNKGKYESGKEFTLTIEAEDNKGAISTKEYKIKTVSDPKLEDKYVEVDLTINEKKSFDIELATSNDTKPNSSIHIIEVIKPEGYGIFDMDYPTIVKEEGKFKLVVSNLVSYQKQKAKQVNITIRYTVNNIIKYAVVQIIYNSDYEQPDIRVGLNKVTNDSDGITLEYKIEPQSFATSEMSSSNKEIGEVIFILDINKNITNGQKTNIKNWMNNILIKKSDYSNLRFGVLGFSDNPLFGVIEHYNNQYFGETLSKVEDINNGTPFFTNDIAQVMDRYSTIVSDIWDKQSSNNRDISDSLIMAKNIFDQFGDENVGKAIVLILGDDINNSQKVSNTVNEIKNSGYKIITLDISSGRSSSLKQFHSSLGGIVSSNDYEGDYLLPESIDENYNNAKKEVQKIADRLKGSITSTNDYSVKPTFTFDLNGNFEYDNICSDNITLDTTNKLENKLKFILDTPIKYTYSNSKNADGEYIYTAPSQTISFEVKVKEGKTGILNFGENKDILDSSTYKNYFEYTKFEGTIIKKPLETPTVLVDDQMEAKYLKHGLYESINFISENTENELIEGNDTRFKFYSPSKIKFGISFETTSKSIKGTLNIDDKFNEVSNINIYKVNNDKLEKINLSEENIKDLNNNDFDINIKNINENKENLKILIVYDASIDEKDINKIFINDFLGKKIKVKSLEKNLNILPDLF